MPLLFGYELSPDIAVCLEPLVWARGEDIMRQDIIVAKRGHDGEGGSVVAAAEDLSEPLRYPSVGAEDLICISRKLLVAIMSRRISRPHHKIDVILYVFLNPFEGFIYERERSIAVGGFCAVYSRSTLPTMAGLVR
jgi:hypothetical protein